ALGHSAGANRAEPAGAKRRPRADASYLEGGDDSPAGRHPSRAATQVRRVSLNLQSRATARGFGPAAAGPPVGAVGDCARAGAVGARVSACAAEAGVSRSSSGSAGGLRRKDWLPGPSSFPEPRARRRVRGARGEWRRNLVGTLRQLLAR